ncbi:MAG: HlyD family type I secretion periplasmic adaptor subunit [Proteobacteria bacterium]|nr:HlyD family type I secretion periplasmic adaptor subunit [Pseudomonadota bacterium]
MATGQEDLHFMPDVHAAARRRGHGFAYILTLMTFAFLVIMGTWANYAVLDEVTRGEGRIIPSSKTQIIQNLEGGILAEILVREGDVVEKGDILVRIENTAAQATYRDAQTRFYALLATVERLEAEMEDREMALSEEILKEAPSAVSDQTALFKARARQLKAQIAVLETQAKQRKQEIAEMGSRRRQLERSLELAREELSIMRPLARNGVVPRIDLIRVERQVADLEGEIRTVRLTIPRLRTAAKEAKQRVEEVILSAKADISDELNRARADLNSVTETLLAGEDRVTRTAVRSRVRGTVKEIKQNTIGGVIRPGEDIIEIVPLDDTLLVEAQIRPADIAFLRPGQKSTIKIAAYDFSIYGGLEATVEHISADTIKDEKGENFYRVYLRTARNTLLHQGDELPIIPGMTATIEILTGKKTVLDYILKPILKARDRALRER